MKWLVNPLITAPIFLSATGKLVKKRKRRAKRKGPAGPTRPALRAKIRALSFAIEALEEKKAAIRAELAVLEAKAKARIAEREARQCMKEIAR